MASTNSSATKTLGILAIIAVLALVAFAFLTMPDQRTTGERVGDAIDTLPQGVGKAAEQLERRTPGERLGDAVEETGRDIKEGTDNE